MALTTEQIEELFSFTEKKFVRYYDLQVELVDHLAERIEEELEANPSLSFKTALGKVYNGFGLFGFAKIVQQKEAEVIKTNNRIWRQEVKKFFTIPKIIFTICLFIVIYQLSAIIESVYLGVSLMIFWLLYNIGSLYFFYKHKIKKVKKLLLLRYNPHTSFSWIPVYQYILLVHYENINRFWFTVAILVGVIVQLSYLKLYKKIQLQAFKLYPEAFA